MNFRAIRNRGDHSDFRSLTRRLILLHARARATVAYDLDRGAYDFFLMELHGIWDPTATLHQRLSRASFLAHTLPDTNGYTLGIGLTPVDQVHRGADLPYLTALN